MLRTKENIFENNYTKYTNDINNPIKAKTNKIRITAAKLGHILTKEERNFIREKLYKLENKKRFTKSEKQRALAYLIKLANTLDKKEKYQHSDHDDQDYFGIRDIDHLFTTIDDTDYYKPILTRESFNGKYQYYELRGEIYKNSSLKQYISTITPEIAELIRNKSTNQNEQKMQLTMNINFMHTTDPNKNRNFYVKSDNVQIRPGSNINDALIKLLESFSNNYQKEEQILRNGSNYTFESVDMRAIHFHDIELKRGSSYIDSHKRIKNKKVTINPKNLKDSNCFQYAIIAALHHQDIRNNIERITKLKSFINNYNWKYINFPAGPHDWNKFERYNNNIALNILSVPHINEKINIQYKSDHNCKQKNQVVLLMITDNNKNWHYLAVKSISRLFRGITSNNNGDFYCLNSLHSFRTDNALKKHK